MRLETFPGRATGAVVLAAVALFVAACGGSSSGTGHDAVATASGKLGTYLTDSSGRALYLWLADGKGASACMGGCAKEWPPLTTHGKPSASGSVTAADLGTIKRSDGQTQVTYKGHPLYRFEGDTGAGQTTGQGVDDFGAKWWLVGRTGAAITKPAAASSTSSSSGGGW